MLVGAATLPNLFDSILLQYEMVLKFFHLEDAGRVLIKGVKEKGDVLDTEGISQAFALGKAI